MADPENVFTLRELNRQAEPPLCPSERWADTSIVSSSEFDAVGMAARECIYRRNIDPKSIHVMVPTEGGYDVKSLEPKPNG